MRNLFLTVFMGLLLPLAAGAAPKANSGGGGVGDGKYDCSKQENLTEEYKKELTDAIKKEFPSAQVKCTSCYRDEKEQLAACKSICGKESCPGQCAKPGSSQHQKKIAVCDISGIPSVQKGCDFFKKLCDEKFDGKCGIGGYGGGSHHFGAGDTHFSSWNQCSYLRGQGSPSPTVGQDLNDKWKRLRQSVFQRSGS